MGGTGRCSIHSVCDPLTVPGEERNSGQASGSEVTAGIPAQVSLRPTHCPSLSPACVLRHSSGQVLQDVGTETWVRHRASNPLFYR